MIKYYLHGENLSAKISDEKFFDALKQLIEKYKDFYKKFPKAYSERLRFLGTLSMLLSREEDARNYFIQSPKIYPLNFYSLRNFFVSIFGEKVFKFLLELKKQMWSKIKIFILTLLISIIV